MELQFESTTAAVLRYIELSLKLGTTHSIPLGIKKTHVGKTDSQGHWQRIYEEYARLCWVMPKSHTDEWYYICINLTVSAMPEERRKFLEDKLEKKISPYLFERRSNQIFRDLTLMLKAHNMLSPESDRRYERSTSDLDV